MARPMLEMAVNPRTAYPVAYTPFKDKAKRQRCKRRRSENRRQFSQMSREIKESRAFYLP
jgi:hypothetical protein